MQDGRLLSIKGDIAHPFTKGQLCAVGNAYLDLLYSPDRILYPMRQIERGSGNWEKISWNEALTLICGKILELKKQYQTTLPIWVENQSGNLGILHHALRGFFNSIGYVSYTGGQLCSSAGIDAFLYTFGELPYSNPQGIINSNRVFIWGGNPAWTSSHQMRNLVKMKLAEKEIIVIDPLYTATAALANYYYQIKPGADGALALAIVKILIRDNLINKEFINKNTIGFNSFKSYLETIELAWVEEETGLSGKDINDLALLYGKTNNPCIITGLGLQRYSNGGQTIRAITMLPVLTGNIGRKGGGIYYAHFKTDVFPKGFLFYKPPTNLFKNAKKNSHRYLPIYRLGKEIMDTTDPPVKMAFISNSNPLSQHPNNEGLREAFKRLDLIVTVDSFLTATAKEADIFLPTTTFFEHEDLNCSYWHPWIGYNQRAIEPLGEAKSDIEIASFLSKKMNELEPGSSGFPTDRTEREFMEEELKVFIKKGIPSKIDQLRTKGYCLGFNQSIAWEDLKFPTPSGKVEIFSLEARRNGLPALPRYLENKKKKAAYPFRLLSIHPIMGINSQSVRVPFYDKNDTQYAYIGQETAKSYYLKTGDSVRIYNDNGEIKIRVQVLPTIPSGVVVCYQGKILNGDKTINALTSSLPSDMGEKSSGHRGVAYHDTFVGIQRMG